MNDEFHKKIYKKLMGKGIDGKWTNLCLERITLKACKIFITMFSQLLFKVICSTDCKRVQPKIYVLFNTELHIVIYTALK
jgi:hypothetical protein